MKISEITLKKDKDLLSELDRLGNQLIKTKFEVASKESNKHTEVKKIKKDIARIKTILREREIQREESADEKNV